MPMAVVRALAVAGRHCRHLRSQYSTSRHVNLHGQVICCQASSVRKPSSPVKSRSSSFRSLPRITSRRRHHQRTAFRHLHATQCLQQRQQDANDDQGVGTVQGVWIFCRHGDRTPARSLVPERYKQREAAFWMTTLPNPDSAAAFAQLSSNFPLRVHEDDGAADTATTDAAADTTSTTVSTGSTFLDVRRNPFGFLTALGLRQLNEVGQAFFERYHCAKSEAGTRNNAESSMDAKQITNHRLQRIQKTWDVTVYSTNYLRTVMSAQSFLDGFYGTNSLSPAILQPRQHDASICEEARVPNHEWRPENHTGDQRACRAGAVVPVQVRAVRSDPLNAFDRDPDTMADLIGQVMLSPEFIEGDTEAAPLAKQMGRILPGLMRHKNRQDNAACDATSGQKTGGHSWTAGTPSGINWVEAADHFVCRRAHGLLFSHFADAPSSPTAVDSALFTSTGAFAAPINGMEEWLETTAFPQTLKHLRWRFRQWYHSKRLLAAVAGPPLREVAQQMLLQQRKHRVAAPNQSKPFAVYACHDITILGLLYGIGADFLMHEEKTKDDDGGGNHLSSWRQFWPTYASTLVFELVRTPPLSASQRERYLVRVRLNGETVQSVHGNNDNQMLVQDFVRAIGNL